MKLLDRTRSSTSKTSKSGEFAVWLENTIFQPFFRRVSLISRTRPSIALLDMHWVMLVIRPLFQYARKHIFLARTVGIRLALLSWALFQVCLPIEFGNRFSPVHVQRKAKNLFCHRTMVAVPRACRSTRKLDFQNKTLAFHFFVSNERLETWLRTKNNANNTRSIFSRCFNAYVFVPFFERLSTDLYILLAAFKLWSVPRWRKRTAPTFSEIVQSGEQPGTHRQWRPFLNYCPPCES